MEKTNDPNSFDKEVKDAGIPANPVEPTEIEGTEQKETVTTEQPEGDVDYKKKFADSAKGAHELLQEKKRLEARIAELETTPPSTTPTADVTEDMYPGFEELDEEAKQTVNAYTDAITRKVTESVYQDPSIAHSRKVYNESKFDSALGSIVAEYPDLGASREDFKSKFYNPNNVPDNIQEILRDMAKSYLYDQARDLGIEEGRKIAERVELEDTTGGDRTPSAKRTLSDWNRIAQENPAKFATMQKEYQSDLESGLLQE